MKKVVPKLYGMGTWIMCNDSDVKVVPGIWRSYLPILQWVYHNPDCPVKDWDDLYFLFIKFGGPHSLRFVQWLRNQG